MGFFDGLFGPRVASISPRKAYERLQEDPRVLIVDVRQPHETRSAVVAGAALIPLTDLGRRMDELPRDRPLLVICRSGHRSSIAARQLKKAGYEVTDVSGGMSAWLRQSLPVVPPDKGSAGMG